MIHDYTKLPFTHSWNFLYDLSWTKYISLLRGYALMWSRLSMQDRYDFLCFVPRHLILPGSCKIEARSSINWPSENCIEGRNYFYWNEHPNPYVRYGTRLAKQHWSALRIRGVVNHIYIYIERIYICREEGRDTTDVCSTWDLYEILNEIWNAFYHRIVYQTSHSYRHILCNIKTTYYVWFQVIYSNAF